MSAHRLDSSFVNVRLGSLRIEIDRNIFGTPGDGYGVTLLGFRHQSQVRVLCNRYETRR